MSVVKGFRSTPSLEKIVLTVDQGKASVRCLAADTTQDTVMNYV